jgi:hypothetical protein
MHSMLEGILDNVKTKLEVVLDNAYNKFVLEVFANERRRKNEESYPIYEPSWAFFLIPVTSIIDLSWVHMLAFIVCTSMYLERTRQPTIKERFYVSINFALGKGPMNGMSCTMQPILET